MGKSLAGFIKVLRLPHLFDAVHFNHGGRQDTSFDFEDRLGNRESRSQPGLNLKVILVLFGDDRDFCELNFAI